MIDKAVIEKNFSRYARHYDDYSDIQNACATILINQIKNDFRRILDVGSGTGNLTKLLRDKFPQSTIKAVDISAEMVNVARGKLQQERVEFILADAENLDLTESFDLISSNATFQWFSHLEATLYRFRDFLEKGGTIAFSIFGPLTFGELNKSLRKEQGMRINSYNFIKQQDLAKILNNAFKKVTIKEMIFKERFGSLKLLLKKIKYTGTKGDISSKRLWTPDSVRKIEEIYKKDFKEIIATYQVFFCKGVK